LQRGSDFPRVFDDLFDFLHGALLEV
jgi:hypothetical protein